MVSTGEVLKEISLLRWDCSTSVDQIPIKYVKQVGDFLTGPLAHFIDVCISTSQFPFIWKSARISHPESRRLKTRCRLLTGLYTSCALQSLQAFGAQATRPLYWWTIFITSKHLGLQERLVNHNCFARYSGQSYLGHEEGWGHLDGNGRLFKGIWYREV